jgi:hypothetical protein
MHAVSRFDFSAARRDDIQLERFHPMSAIYVCSIVGAPAQALHLSRA